MKEIHITPVLNGFIVKVGCQTVVFNSIDILCAELKRYQKDPEKVEKVYVSEAINHSSPTIDTPPPERYSPRPAEERMPNPEMERATR